jgi:hypothetical protein
MLLLCLAAAGAGAQDPPVEGRTKANLSPEQSAELTRLLPGDGELVDARRAGAIELYDPENLYEYIDGAADVFLAFDFAALVHVVYQYGAVEVTVDVYDMGQLDNAFGIFASERGASVSPCAIGTAGYSAETILNFYHGRFYVKLSAFSEQAAPGPALERLARLVAERIGGEASAPGELKLIPETDRATNSVRFLRRAPLGHEFLGPAFLAKFGHAGHETTLLISRAETPPAAMRRLADLAKYAERVKPPQSAGTLVKGAIKGVLPYEGAFIAWTHEKYLMLILAPPDPPEAFVGRIVAQLAQSGS